jgi:hypothetical protein
MIRILATARLPQRQCVVVNPLWLQRKHFLGNWPAMLLKGTLSKAWCARYRADIAGYFPAADDSQEGGPDGELILAEEDGVEAGRYKKGCDRSARGLLPMDRL